MLPLKAAEAALHDKARALVAFGKTPDSCMLPVQRLGMRVEGLRGLAAMRPSVLCAVSYQQPYQALCAI